MYQIKLREYFIPNYEKKVNNIILKKRFIL